MNSPDRITVPKLRKLKAEGERIACLTAYDASMARLLDRAGVDLVLVGDSLGMVIQGHDTTLSVTMEQMLYHSRAVASSLERALLMVDMPFLSERDPDSALINAGRLLAEGGASMVKLERDARALAGQISVVERLIGAGIPVCAHLGLTPQSVHKLGGYRVQGRDPQQAERIIEEALTLERVGVDLLLLESVPQSLAKRVSEQLAIPVIGIGAGPDCDGQILVLQDLLGITADPPRFSKSFLGEQSTIPDAVEAYIRDVKAGRFPEARHSFN